MQSVPASRGVSSSGYFISAPWRSSGKTILTLGLAAAARRRGIDVQTFKKGPDYIDPLWLRQASGQPCYNLDLYMQSSAELSATFNRLASQASLSLVEGTMGLHDGLACDGSDSNAAVSRLINTPVILVADCRGMHRTVAALVKGIQEFDPDIEFAGLVLNRIRSQRHEDKICLALEQYTDMNLLGAIPECDDLKIQERELGLVPACQSDSAIDLIESAATAIEQNSDLMKLLSCDSNETKCEKESKKESCTHDLNPVQIQRNHPESITIGIARDKAFSFYYQDDLDTLRESGAKLIEISPLTDRFPDNLDGLLIGGGFPERYAAELAANSQFRLGLKHAIQSGLCVRAECGGLMYLCRSIEVENCNYPMVGAIAGDVTLNRRPLGRGYMQLKRRNSNQVLHCHEFHHSKIKFDKPSQFEFDVVRGYGINGESDGVRVNNMLATYAHFRHTQSTPWIDWFLQEINLQKIPEDSPQHV